jgi:hypothetical protein
VNISNQTGPFAFEENNTTKSMPKKNHAQNENATSIIQHNTTKKNMLNTTHAEGNSCSKQPTINTTKSMPKEIHAQNNSQSTQQNPCRRKFMLKMKMQRQSFEENKQTNK